MHNSWRHLLQEFLNITSNSYQILIFLEEFLPEKWDGCGISIWESYKNIVAVCSSDLSNTKESVSFESLIAWHFSQELKLHPFVTLKEKVRFTHMQYASSNMQKSCCHANRKNDLKLLHRYMKLQNNKLLFMLGRDRTALC